jgi:CubicO group peptidase (beta-lactamase class C family)
MGGTVRRFALLLACCLGLRAEDALDAYLRTQMARNHIPGLAVAVVRKGRIEKLAAYGEASLELKAPVTVDSPFQLASGTKLFTSVLVMSLVGEGRLDLDAPVSTYLGPVPDTWKAITVRHLAAHAAGLKPEMAPPDAGSLEAVVKAAQGRPLLGPPGAQAAYGSDDYSVLALILEKVGGRPFPDLLRERVWKPLGLGSAAFEDAISQGPDTRTAEVLPGRVSAYRWQEDRQRLHWFLYPRHAYAAGGAFCSIRDMAAFLQAVDAGKALPPKLRETLWAPFRLTDGRSAGFGVGWTAGTFAGRPCAGHSGGPALSDLLYFPEERVGIIVLANQQRLHPSLARGLAAQLLPPGTRLRTSAIPDGDPAITERHRRVIEGLAAGNANPGEFRGPAAEAFPGAAPWLKLQLGCYPPLTGLALLSESSEGARRTREYRAAHGPTASLRWRVVDSGGSIEDFDVFEE